MVIGKKNEYNFYFAYKRKKTEMRVWLLSILVSWISLPKGTMKEKKVKDKIYYYYLLFREGDRVITKYLGKSEETLILIKEQLVKRKQLEHMLKKLKIYLNFFLKLLHLVWQITMFERFSIFFWCHFKIFFKIFYKMTKTVVATRNGNGEDSHVRSPK